MTPLAAMTHLEGAAVVLLSGGLDSSVAMAALLAQPSVSVQLALSVNYGQKAWPRELQASAALATHYGVRHEVIDLPWMAALLPKGMQADAVTEEQQSLENVWVPNRNGVLLNIAAAYAEAHNARYVVFGANSDEAQAFPDNGQQYWQWVNPALRYSTRNGVQVLAPIGELTKIETVALAQELGLPLELIWSCYGDGETHCGRCTSCQHLQRGLRHQQETRLSVGS